MTISQSWPASSSSRTELLFDRFEALEELGVGGYGRVVRALDHVTGHEVALKVLHRVDNEATERFKKEFRSLVEVEHPNLVRLGELFERRGEWAFSMELVPGSDLLSWVRDRAPRTPGFDEARLRSALSQLASALDALHRAGLIHRDIKPANVRVTPEGRVVLLDFGLVTQLALGQQSTTHHIVGTLVYMAPEQMDTVPITSGVDVYALGVLLYESLTGRVPFSGDLMQLLLAKCGQTPMPPRELCPDVPPDLDALCLTMLATDPAVRPSAPSLFAQLGGGKPPRLSVPAPEDDLFVGRARELSQLNGHFERARRQGPSLVLVEGESGIGKTALISQFMATLRNRSERIHLLRGRCHPFEHVTYKAFDEVAEQLVRVLRARSPQAEPFPRSARLLPLLFPPLSKVPELANARTSTRAERTELFDAFRELLALLTREQPLVIAIDDLHWSDPESAMLLKDALDYGTMQGLLIVASMRTLEARENAALEPLLDHRATSRLSLTALSSDDARSLVDRLLPECDGPARREALLEESGGHPLFLVELARGGCDPLDPATEKMPSLDGAIQSRVAQLAEHARQVLAFVCIAASPLPHGVIADALGVPLGLVYRALAVLRTERLVRSVQLGEVIAYHDRIREAVAGELPEAERTRVHRALAEAFLRAENVSAGRVAYHFMAAGELLLAAPWLERAGDEALSTAGFERAAELYQTRLGLKEAPLEANARKKLLYKLSEALASCGRCSASAHVLLLTLEGAVGEERRELLMRAAQQLLQAGEIDEGLSAARAAMEEVGLAWSQSPVSAVARLAWHGLLLKEIPAGEHAPIKPLSPQAERQLDTLSRLLQPLVWVDLLRCREMITRFTRLAFKHGSPPHIAQALGQQAVMSSLRNPMEENLAVSDRAGEWAELDGSAPVRAYQEFTRGGCLVWTARFREAAAHFERAERLYRTECKGQVWLELNTRGALLGCLFLNGEHQRFARRAGEWMRDAQARGDAWARAQLTLIGRAALRHVLDDRPEQAVAELAEAVEPWRSKSLGLHHVFETDMLHHVLTYLDPERAYAFWNAENPELKLLYRWFKGFVPEVLDVYRAEATLRFGLHVRAHDVLAVARREAVRLANAATPRVRARALLIRAQLLAYDGDTVRARALAQSVETQFRALGEFKAWAGELLASALSSPAARATAEERLVHWLEAGGWKNPQRALEWLLPVYPVLPPPSARTRGPLQLAGRSR